MRVFRSTKRMGGARKGSGRKKGIKTTGFTVTFPTELVELNGGVTRFRNKIYKEYADK